MPEHLSCDVALDAQGHVTVVIPGLHWQSPAPLFAPDAIGQRQALLLASRFLRRQADRLHALALHQENVG